MPDTPKEAEPDRGTQSGDEQEQMDNQGEQAAAGLEGFEVKEQDRWLPIANVARIMKLALPDNAKIAKEAKECMQECVSEFISFITSEASEKCQQEKRKTVNGEDILFAMTSLGFENYAEALKIYLSKYRERKTKNLNPDADWDETQSARGENQQARPSSSGGAGGYSTSSGGAPGGPNSASAGYPATGPGDDPSILSGLHTDSGEHEGGYYGQPHGLVAGAPNGGGPRESY